MKKQILVAIRLFVVATFVCGIIYPVAVLLVSNVTFPRQAQGSLIHDHKQIVGSSLLGQTYNGDQWFQTRPSHAGAGYDATASGAGNLGPTNKILIETINQRARDYRKDNGLSHDAAVPVDAVTASGSGLDPQISIANALIQASRVARVRRLSLDHVKALIKANEQSPFLGFLGEKTVNVVTLNRDLDIDK